MQAVHRHSSCSRHTVRRPWHTVRRTCRAGNTSNKAHVAHQFLRFSGAPTNSKRGCTKRIENQAKYQSARCIVLSSRTWRATREGWQHVSRQHVDIANVHWHSPGSMRNAQHTSGVQHAKKGASCATLFTTLMHKPTAQDFKGRLARQTIYQSVRPCYQQRLAR